MLGDSQEVDWKKPGPSMEFVKQLAGELGLKVVIKRLPWQQALELELKSEAIDELFPASLPARSEDVRRLSCASASGSDAFRYSRREHPIRLR